MIHYNEVIYFFIDFHIINTINKYVCKKESKHNELYLHIILHH